MDPMNEIEIKPGEYVYVVERATDGTLWAYFPDLPGCATAADTIEELQANIAEVLELHLSSYRERGEQPPTSGSVKIGVVAAA